VAADVTGSAGDENGFVWHNWSVYERDRENEWMNECVNTLKSKMKERKKVGEVFYRKEKRESLLRATTF
jgi:hypothetical protein